MIRKPLIPLYKATEKYNWNIVSRPRFVSEGLCEWCGKQLKNKRQKTFCSKQCSRYFNNAVVWNCSHKGYAKQITIRDKYTCQICGEIKTYVNEHGIEIPTDDGIEIHHIIPVCTGGTDSPENLICVCCDCHKKIHGQTKNENSLRHTTP